MSDTELRLTPGQKIAGIVDQLLTKKGRPPAGAGQDLREAGLTSLDMVNLMLAVEDEFDIILPQAAMTPENFRTVATIEALVAGLV